MATGTGLDAQFATGNEATVGTIATLTKFWPFDEAGLTFTPTYIEGSGIRAGQRFRGIGDTGISRKNAGGKAVLPVTMKGFGWWMKYLLGSTASPVTDGTTAYKQIHKPAGMKGVSFSAQVGKPEPGTGTVQPRTYNGCKITDWTLTIADGEPVKLDMTIDAWNQDSVTGLAAATYVTGNTTWNFGHCNVFKIGGTAATAAGETTITGGASVTSVVKSLSISGKYTYDSERFGVGNAGVKKEQLETDFVEMTGDFEGEYDTAFDTPFVAGTTTAFQIDLTGPEIEAGKPYLFSVIVPAAKITDAPSEVSGPGIVAVKGSFKVYDPELSDSTPPIQIKIRSTDATL